jgi:protoheme ferro-lyase
MACVLRHVIAERPAAAVVVTDGFIEKVEPKLVQDALSRSRIHVIVSRHGSPLAVEDAGLPYTQLKRFPS